MRIVDFDSFNKEIEKRRNKVELELLKNRTERTFRRKPRNEDEKRILDILAKNQWDKAVTEGKIRYLSERVMFYDFD